MSVVSSSIEVPHLSQATMIKQAHTVDNQTFSMNIAA